MDVTNARRFRETDTDRGVMLKRLGKIWVANWQGFTRCQSGVSAIEFVAVAPFVFLILGVTLETGFMFFTEFTLQASVEDAARSIRTGSAQMSNLSAANFKTKVCSTVGSLIDCAGAVTVYVRSDNDFATLKANLPSPITIGPTTGITTVSAPACYNPGAPQKPAIIIATYDWNFVTFGMSAAFGNVSGGNARRLIGLTVFLNQNYPGATAGTC